MSTNLNLSGVQVQALVWAAFKDGVKPPKRALDQVAEMELVSAPVKGHDPHYRILDAGWDELRKLKLDRPRRGRKRTCVPRADQVAA